jgi:hypothetical protein
VGLCARWSAVVRQNPARHGFFEEWEHQKSPTAKLALDRIGPIYGVEARAAFAPISEHGTLRRETAPLVDAFFEWPEATVTKLWVKSSLAGVFSYAITELKRTASVSEIKIYDTRQKGLGGSCKERSQRGSDTRRRHPICC